MPRIWDMHVHPYFDEAVQGYGIPFSRLAESLQHSRTAHFSGDSSRPISLQETVEHLDQAGAEGGIVVNVDSVRWGSQVSNAGLAERLRSFAPKLRFFPSVDPNRGPAARRELERSLREDGAIGLKLHPSYQDFFPNDRKLAYPLYEICQAAGVPVLLHSGTCWLHQVPIEQSRPIHLDQVALDFPDLRLILAHGGWPWADELIAVVWRHQHVYMDLSGNLPRFLPAVIWHYANIGAVGRKMLFGSDYPFISPRQWVEAFSAFNEWFYPQENRVETWREGVKERILGQNFVDL
ncbi:MAG: amidohydrolase, partial [Chloroflexota bacterium]|nr:amidohydrolase [Chloroflexota bacterium]